MDMISISMDRMRLMSPPSSQKIVLEDEDLLTLILLRIPWKKLMSLKCVSKQWLSFITSPHFRDLLPPLRASGLFINHVPTLGGPDKLYFVPLDDPRRPFPFRNIRTFTFPHHLFNTGNFHIMLYCNGLLLCSTSIYVSSNCFVYHPSTNQVDILPQPPRNLVYIGLAFDPLKSFHYKVIAFVCAHGSKNVGDFHIYSSETRTWRVSIQSFVKAPGFNFSDDGVYWNGCVHWLSVLNKKIVPKPSFSGCFYFNVDEERLETFPSPPIDIRSTSRRSLYFGESEGHLHVIEVFPCTTTLKVYEMKSDYSGWFVKYRIHLAPISKVFPEMTQHKTCFDGQNHFAVAVLSLIRRESFLEDSFLVLEIPGKVIRYNIVDRSFKVILDFCVESYIRRTDYWAFGRLKVSQYMALL